MRTFLFAFVLFCASVASAQIIDFSQGFGDGYGGFVPTPRYYSPPTMYPMWQPYPSYSQVRPYGYYPIYTVPRYRSSYWRW